MNEQPSIEGKVLAFARRTDPDTSHTAAESVTPRVRQLQLDVLAYASTVPGFTDPDMNAHFGVHSSTYRTRRSELVGLGMIADTGQRRCLGETGRKHAVWVITDLGLTALNARAAA